MNNIQFPSLGASAGVFAIGCGSVYLAKYVVKTIGPEMTHYAFNGVGGIILFACATLIYKDAVDAIIPGYLPGTIIAGVITCLTIMELGAFTAPSAVAIAATALAAHFVWTYAIEQLPKIFKV